LILGIFSAIFIRELYPNTALKNESEEKPGKKPNVRADISPYLQTTLTIISEKLKVSKSTIVNNALGYYFKNEFREAFPKSEAELRLQAQENENLKKYTQQFRQAEEIKYQISLSENSIKFTKNQIKTYETKLNTKVKLINKIDDKNSPELEKLQNEKSDLEKNLIPLKKILMDAEKRLEDLKKQTPDETPLLY